MPKEVIYPDTPIDPDDDFAFAPFAMAVGWQKDYDVQVGITTIGDRHLIGCLLNGGTADGTVENMVHLGRSAMIAIRQKDPEWTLDFVSSDSEDRFAFDVGCAISEHLSARYPDWKSLWWHPTRTQINKLIRLLRTARDSAFGRDE